MNLICVYNSNRRTSLKIFIISFIHVVQISNAVNADGILSTTYATDAAKFTSKNSMEHLSVEEQWKQVETNAKDIMKNLVKNSLPTIMRITSNMNISSTCVRDTMILFRGIQDIKSWALRFVDASAKTIDGILGGTVSSFGNYDECINAMVYTNKTNSDSLFQGKYCLVDIKMPLPEKKSWYRLAEIPAELKNFSKSETVFGELTWFAYMFHFMSLRLGFCIPSGCSVNDVQQIATYAADSLLLKANAISCEVKKDYEFTPLIITIISIYCVLVVLVLIGSFIDFYTYHTGATFSQKGIQMLLAFSFISNFKKFINTKSSSDALNCLNGVKFITMSWIILGHTYFLLDFQILNAFHGNLDTSLKKYREDFAFQAITNAGSTAVTTFFFMGGLLVCYRTIKYVKISKKKLNISFYILYRLWRIVPVYIGVIVIIFLKDLVGSGPMFHIFNERFTSACYDKWWTNLLFINNLFHAKDICLPQTWYISCDMQFYVASLIILLPLLRRPKLGIFIILVCILTSMIYSGVVIYFYRYPPAILFIYPDPDDLKEIWTNFYFSPYVNAVPYCVGLFFGYILATKQSIKIPKIIQIIGWCCATSLCLAVLYGSYDWIKRRNPYLMEATLYAACSRIAWSLGLAWMIVCCATGHGGVINYILSWKIWIPLGRLTFIAYLVHPMIQVLVFGSFKNSFQINHVFMVWFFLGFMCMSYGSAFLLHMLIEAPVLGLQKLVFHKKENLKKDENFITEHNGCIENSTLKLTKENNNIPVVLVAKNISSDG